MQELNPFVAVLRQELNRHRDTESAESMQAYMKNQFCFLGVKTPLRREILSRLAPNSVHIEPFNPDWILCLWTESAREFQYCALDIMRKQVQHIREDDLQLVVNLIITKSWWDTVDGLSSWIVGPYFLKFPEHRAEITGEWAVHEKMWLRRASIIFQLGYKEKTDSALLFHHIRLNLGSKEFFINKAIGWALREYAKTDAEVVKRFVSKTELHPLSKREALRRLK